MKELRIANALNYIDDDLISDAVTYMPKKAKHPVWTKWVAMAACLCLVVGGAISLFWQRETTGTGGYGADLTLYELTMVGDELYFTDQTGGVFRYISGADAPEKLADMKGTLTKTSDGLYFTDYDKKVFYQIKDAELQKLIEADSGELVPWFIDLLDGFVYWCTDEYVEGSNGEKYNNVTTYRTNTATGDTELLFAENVSILKPEYISDNKLYYETYRGEIRYFDISTGNTSVLSDEFYSDNGIIEIRDRTYYNDCMILHVDETLHDENGNRTGMIRSLYRMPYDGSSAVKLTDLAPESFEPVRVGDELYYTAMLKTETGSHLAFVSCNINTGETEELTQYPEELANMAFELAVHEDGIYVTNPRYKEGGVYFYDNATSEAKLIYE